MIDAKTFALGTLVLLGIGVPSLAVGIFELGIERADRPGAGCRSRSAH